MRAFALEHVPEDYPQLCVTSESAIPGPDIATSAPSAFLRGQNGDFIFKVLAPTPLLGHQTVPDQVSASLSFQNMLHTSGVPVALPEINERGSFVTTASSANGMPLSYTLTRYVPHDPWQATQRRASCLADILAHMHELHGPWPQAVTDLPQRNLFSQVVDLLQVSEQELKSKRLFHKSRFLQSQWRQVSEQAARRVNCERKNAEKLGYGAFHSPIHGDFHPHNVLMASNEAGPLLIEKQQQVRVAAVIDFDCICYDDHGDDVARAALHLELFDLKGELPTSEALQRAEPLMRFFFQRYAENRSSKNIAFFRYFKEIVRAVGMHIGVLYFLKSLHPVQSCTDLISLTDAINGASYLQEWPGKTKLTLNCS